MKVQEYYGWISSVEPQAITFRANELDNFDFKSIFDLDSKGLIYAPVLLTVERKKYRQAIDMETTQKLRPGMCFSIFNDFGLHHNGRIERGSIKWRFVYASIVGFDFNLPTGKELNFSPAEREITV